MRLKVEPDVVALAPGDVTDLLVRVHNDGEDTCTPFLQVRGVDPDDVLLPDEVVAVPAGSVMTAVVRVRAAADAIPGDQRIAIAAEDLDGAQGTVSATTVLRIGARPDVAVEVDPVATVGRRGANARTILRNRSDRRLQVELEGRGEGVRVSFRPSRVTLDPGETKRVPTRMRRAQRSWFGEIRHGAVITARGIGAPASTTATFMQKPSIPRPAVRGVAALTALAVWVAATVVVFNRINAEPDAGPDSGVVAAPAAPGPGRTSATGMFEEGTEDGVRLPVVIQGSIEGPRDPAGTTVTAERIGFGDQGTTTGLTKVVALAEVKLPRGNVLDVVRTTTDERGRFRIASGLVEEAFYRVTAVRAGFEVGSFIVSTSADQPEVTIAIALEPATGSLAGAVTDTVGAPVGGATVVVTDGSAEYTTVTPSEGDDVGRWVLGGLATPATYQVLVSRRGFAAQTLIVELDGGQALRGVDAVLTADLGTIVGRVTDANPDPNQPGVAQGVGALTVTLAGPEARETRTLTVAGDLRGTFDLPGLPYGDYTITFVGDGVETRQAEVSVDRGLVRLDATINRSTGLVQGWVWQFATTDEAPQLGCRFPRADQRDDGAPARDRPCGGVAVMVSSDDGDVLATASANGTGFFQLGGVPAGEYTLTLSRSGYLSRVQSITVDPGQTFNLNPLRTDAVVDESEAVEGRDFIGLGLEPPPSVCSGTVVLTLIDFRDGQGIPPVADASFVPNLADVITVEDANCGDTAPRATRIGTSGSYRIDNVPLGLQTIVVGGANVAARWPYVEREVDVQVSAAEASAATLNILPNPRPLTLPAGSIAMTGADRTVFLQALNAAGSVVGSGPPEGILIQAGQSNTDAVVLDLVSPDRNLSLRAVGEGSPSRGYRTVTSEAFALPPGLGAFELPDPLPRLTVVATTTVTVTVRETVVLGATSTADSPVADATVAATSASAPDGSGTTGADGTVALTLDSGATYTLGVTKTGYATASGLSVVVGSATTQAATVTLLAAAKLRVFGQVSDRVRSVRVLDGASEVVGIVTGLDSGTKSYAIDGLPIGGLLQVDFHASADGTGTPLVTRWIQVAQAGNVSIQLDQDAEPGDIGSITVNVEVPEAPDGVTTPVTVSVRLIEDVPADFYSIGATGVITAASAACTGTPRTCTVTFPGLATAASSTSLPTDRFTVAIDETGPVGSTTLIPTGYVASTAGSFTSVEVGGTKTLVLRTQPGAPAAPTLTVVPQSGAGNQQIDVSWSAPSNTGGAAAADLTYVVGHRVGDSGAFTELLPTGAGVTSASITGLSAGTTHEVRVRAVSTAGGVALVGADSPVATSTTADVPGTPTGLAATATSSSLDISWVAPAANGSAITSYTVTVGGTVRCSGSPATSCDVTGLDASTDYLVSVTAINAVGTGHPATGTFATSAPPDSLLSGFVANTEYRVARSSSTAGTFVERGWFFRVDTIITVDELFGGGDAALTWTLRLREAGTSAVPSEGGAILGWAQVAGIACSTTSLPGDKLRVGPTVGSGDVGTVQLVPGTWYAVTSEDTSSTGPHCNAGSDVSVSFGTAGTSTRRYGSSPGVPIGFRVSSIP